MIMAGAWGPTSKNWLSAAFIRLCAFWSMKVFLLHDYSCGGREGDRLWVCCWGGDSSERAFWLTWSVLWYVSDWPSCQQLFPALVTMELHLLPPLQRHTELVYSSLMTYIPEGSTCCYEQTWLVLKDSHDQGFAGTHWRSPSRKEMPVPSSA